jgi:short-subunit dehydrogenase
MDIRSKRMALITGGSKGIGAAIAKKMTELGYEVAIIARDKNQLESVRNYLVAEGAVVHALQANLTQKEDINRISKFVEKYAGQLKVLVHNAGMAKVGSVQNMPLEDWKAIFDLNLTAPFLLTQKLLPFISEKSKILFINSVAGKRAFPEWGAYSASKFALRALADALREEVRSKHIAVTTIYPAAVDTPLHDAMPYDWNRSLMLKAQNVAEAVEYCVKTPPHVLVNDLQLENLAGTF